MPSEYPLTTWTDSRKWVSDGTRLAQKTELLDLQFQYGGGSSYRTAIRFLANGDVRVYGDFISENGALRSYSTFAMTVYDSLSGAQDIVSFRTGGGSGTELLRIEKDGTITGNAQAINLKSTVLGTGDVVRFYQGTAQVGALGTETYGNYLKIASSQFYLNSSTRRRLSFIFDTSWTQQYIVDDDGDAGINLTVQENDYAFIRVGGAKAGAPTRQGRVFIDRDSTTDAEVAGFLVLYDKNGGANYIWVDANGKLRVNLGVPATDTSGTIVGTQT